VVEYKDPPVSPPGYTIQTRTLLTPMMLPRLRCFTGAFWGVMSVTGVIDTGILTPMCHLEGSTGTRVSAG
jgi:hypothetical protein